MLAKLVGKCLYFPPEWVDEGSLTSDGWKEFEQHGSARYVQGRRVHDLDGRKSV